MTPWLSGRRPSRATWGQAIPRNRGRGTQATSPVWAWRRHCWGHPNPEAPRPPHTAAPPRSRHGAGVGGLLHRAVGPPPPTTYHGLPPQHQLRFLDVWFPFLGVILGFREKLNFTPTACSVEKKKKKVRRESGTTRTRLTHTKGPPARYTGADGVLCPKSPRAHTRGLCRWPHGACRGQDTGLSHPEGKEGAGPAHTTPLSNTAACPLPPGGL